MLSAIIDEFEIDISMNEQTFKHIQFFVYKLGIQQTIVAVNRTDATEPPFSEKRFD
jgi:elongation factor 1-alpha